MTDEQINIDEPLLAAIEAGKDVSAALAAALTRNDMGFTPMQLQSLRWQNEREYAGWNPGRFFAEHERTWRDTNDPAGYVAGVRRHLSSGLYRAIYPPAAIAGSERFLRHVKKAKRGKQR